MAEDGEDGQAGPGTPQLQPGGLHHLPQGPGGLELLSVAGDQGASLGGQTDLSLPASLLQGEGEGEEREGLGET